MSTIIELTIFPTDKGSSVSDLVFDRLEEV